MSKHAPIEFELKPKELRAMGFEYDKDECVEFIEKTPHVSKCVNMHDEMIREIKSVLDNFNPKECSCDGEYEDGRLVGHACYFHRNEEILRNLLAKAEGE